MKVFLFKKRRRPFSPLRRHWQWYILDGGSQWIRYIEKRQIYIANVDCKTKIYCIANSSNALTFVSLLRKHSIMYPYTAERRDVLENTLPEAQEISRAKVGVFSNISRLEAVYGHSFRISREVLILWCDNRWL